MINKVSFQKIVRDLLLEKNRTLIVLASIILGVFSATMMSTAYSLLQKNLQANYLNTKPASFTIIGNNINKDILGNQKNVDYVEERQKIVGRIKLADNRWMPVWLFVVDDFTKMNINVFTLEKGEFPQDSSQIVFERTGLRVMNCNPGQNIIVNLTENNQNKLHVSGIVHDPGQAPSWMEGVMFGYVQKSFLKNAGLSATKQEIKVIVSGKKFELKHISNVLIDTKRVIQQNGGVIERTEILPPGKHIHQSQMNSLMFLLGMFGLLTLFLSCFLIITLISAMMARQKQQIGIMKAVGASTARITIMYLSIVVIMALFASLIALPVGYYAGLVYSRFTASMLNFIIIDSTLSVYLLIAQAAMGLLFSLLITCIPIYLWGKISVYEAFNGEGTTKIKNNGLTLIDKLKISNTLKYAIRNAVRKKVRLALTLITMTLAGAFLITAFNIQSSTDYTIAKNFDNQKYDISVKLERNYQNKLLINECKAINEIKDITFEQTANAVIIDKNGLDGVPVKLKAINPQSSFYNPNLTNGNWLKKTGNGVVINHELAARYPGLKINDTLLVKFDNVVKRVPVIGIVKELFTQASFYMNLDYFQSIAKNRNITNSILISLNKKENINDNIISQKIEKEFNKKGVIISDLMLKSNYKNRVVDHLIIITRMLITITFLLIIVGGLGLIITTGINVMERKRELGILRAIGVSDKVLYKIFLYEGVIIGIITWLFSVIIAVPLSYYLGNKFFIIFFESTIDFKISQHGFLLWGIIVVVLSGIAVLIPAKNTIKLTVNQTLVYE